MVPRGTPAPSDRTAGGSSETARAVVLVRRLIKFAGGALSRWLERRLIGRPRSIPEPSNGSGRCRFPFAGHVTRRQRRCSQPPMTGRRLPQPRRDPFPAAPLPSYLTPLAHLARASRATPALLDFGHQECTTIRR
ncbi:hypothetical protein MTO96_011632 [Rhipicephalus appendiculatus]